jgi:hypothetical protein
MDIDISSKQILIITDLHGNLTLLKKALDEGNKIANYEQNLAVILLGDYCDNGPEIPELLDFLSEIELNEGKYKNMKIYPIMGNHDLACLLALDSTKFGVDTDIWWEKWNSTSMIIPGYSTPEQYGLKEENFNCKSFLKIFPKKHYDYLNNLPLYIKINKYIFVHSGLYTNISVDEQLHYLKQKNFSSWKYDERKYGMPDQLTNMEKNLNNPTWDNIIVSGHSRFSDGNDFVGSNHLKLHSGVQNRMNINDDPPRFKSLHAAIIKADANNLIDSPPILFDIC